MNGALRLLYLQLYVDDGGFASQTARADVATNRLSSSMRQQAAINRQYWRDIAITAAGAAVAVGMMAAAYAKVQEAAMRTAFAQTKAAGSTADFANATQAAIDRSMALSEAMAITVDHAQELNLALSQTGISGQQNLDALAKAGILLSRVTNGQLSPAEGSTNIYRLLKTTTTSPADLDRAQKAASLYASEIAIAGANSVAGAAGVEEFAQSFKDVAAIIPLTTEQIIALSAATSDYSDAQKTLFRTSITRLYAKDSATNFPLLSNAVFRNANQSMLQGLGVSTAADLERVRAQDPIAYLNAIASAAQNLSRHYNAATDQFEGSSILDARTIQNQLGLTTRDVVAVGELSTQYGKYNDVLNQVNEQVKIYNTQGEDGLAISRYNSAWLGSLTGQWDQLWSALTRVNTGLMTTFSLLTSVPMSLAVGLVNGLAASPLLTGGLGLAGGGYVVKRIGGIRSQMKLRLAALDSRLGIGAAEVAGAEMEPTILTLSQMADLRRQNRVTAEESAIYDLLAPTYSFRESGGKAFLGGDPRLTASRMAAARIHSEARTERALYDEMTVARREVALRELYDYETVGFVGPMLPRLGRLGITRSLKRFFGGDPNATLGQTATDFMSGDGALGMAGPIGAVIIALAALAPVFKGLANSLNDVIARGGAFSGLLRIVRTVFRTLELAGEGIMAVFKGVWYVVGKVLGAFGIDVGGIGQGFNDALDKFDTTEQGWSTSLTASGSKSVARSGGNTTYINVNNNSVDPTVAMVRNINLATSGMSVVSRG